MILIPIRTRGSNAREHWQQRHPYLARILQGHFAANGVDCQTPEATQALLCIRERMLERVPGEDDE